MHIITKVFTGTLKEIITYDTRCQHIAKVTKLVFERVSWSRVKRKF